MTTVRSGSALRVTVTACIPPSATVYAPAPNDAVTCGSSSSVMSKVTSVVVPACTPLGSVPKVSFTLSSSSSSVSWVALKVKNAYVCPVLNITFAGTPE